MLDFQVAPRYYGLGDVEAKDSNFFYNQKGIENLSVLQEIHTGTEKTAHNPMYAKILNRIFTINWPGNAYWNCKSKGKKKSGKENLKSH